MINLIPTIARKRIITEYWVRVGTIWLWLAAVLLMIVMILLIPVYVLIKSQTAIYAAEAEKIASEVNEFGISSVPLVQASARAKMLLDNIVPTNFSEIVDVLENIKGETIVIESYDFGEKNKIIGPVTITGKANTREDLANFRGRLNEHPKIHSVFLPISNLAGGSDILFSLTVNVASST